MACLGARRTRFASGHSELFWDGTRPAWLDPDHVAVVIHNFRTRYGLANGDPQYDALNAKLQTFPVISVPTITIATDFDGANANGSPLSVVPDRQHKAQGAEISTPITPLHPSCCRSEPG
jgi:hypothetical protein